VIIVGILGVLLIAKHQELIGVVKPLMDALMDALMNEAGFRISPKLYQTVLKSAGE
jgi:uncharacterized protein